MVKDNMKPVHNPTASKEALVVHIQGLLQQIVAPKHIHNAVIAVETMDRSFRWVGAAGDAHPDGSPMLVDTPFCIASVTKLYIAGAILKLHERGLVRLDQPISTYLPQALIGGLHRLGGVDYTDHITLHHLLSHTSGLPDYFEDRPKGGRNLIERLMEQDFTFGIEDIVRLTRELPPHFPPQPLDEKRRKVRYCDTNYQLLYATIEAVTGQSRHAAFTELLYQPLGLEHTWHPGARPDAPEPATLWFGEKPAHIPLGLRSFGDLISTADDMLRFMRRLIRGEVFDNPATLELMMGRWHTFGFSFSLAPLSPNWPIQYGLGMMRFQMPRLFSPFRPTPAVVGHTGATGSWLFYCVEQDVLLAGTVNQASAGAAPFRIVPKILAALESVA